MAFTTASYLHQLTGLAGHTEGKGGGGKIIVELG